MMDMEEKRRIVKAMRDLAGGRETFRMRGDEFGMTIFD
jgi:hypothetical protein